MKTICIFSKLLEIHKTKKIGGVEKHVSDLIKEVSKKFKIIIISSKPPSEKKVETTKNITTYYTESEINSNPLSDFKYFREAIQIFEKIKKKENIVLVHNQNDLMGKYLKNIDIPIITTLHRTIINDMTVSLQNKPWLFPAWAILFPILQQNYKNTLTYSNKLISVGNSLKKSILKQYTIPSEKINVIYNGVDLNKFSPELTKSELKMKTDISDKDLLIFGCSNLIKQKGFHILIEAFNKIQFEIPNTKIIIAGDGPFKKNLRKIIRDLNLEDKVILLGRISPEKISTYYKISDIFAFPTLRREGLPYSLIEAMACGQCSLSSRVGATEELITHGHNGLLTKKGDVNEFAIQLKKILNSPNLRNNIGKNASLYAKNNLSKKKMISDTIEFYIKTINN